MEMLSLVVFYSSKYEYNSSAVSEQRCIRVFGDSDLLLSV